MENKMTEVARLLDLDLDEEFKVNRPFDKEKFYTCKLTQEGLFRYVEQSYGNKWVRDEATLSDLLIGSVFDVVRAPYKPKKGGRYWTFNIDGFNVVDCTWNNWAQEFALLKCGAIFRTKAEAIAARPRIYKELTGKEWTE